jgi:hypothetical protein
MKENIVLIVSGETYKKMAAEGVRPSSEKRHTITKSGEIALSVVGRVWARVLDIGAS